MEGLTFLNQGDRPAALGWGRQAGRQGLWRGVSYNTERAVGMSWTFHCVSLF